MERRCGAGVLVALACMVLVPTGVGQARGDEPSQLERDPAGWIDPMEKAGVALAGWTRVPIPPGDDLREASPWMPEPDAGVLVCNGVGVHEWLRFDQEQGDAVYHVEWRFVPAPGASGYNSGIMIRCSPDGRVWHQAQTGDAAGGYLFGETPGPANGALGAFDLSRKVMQGRVKPAGEWNTFEITAKGNTLTLWVNGATTCAFDRCGQQRGHFGLEAEGFKIEFRNVRIKPLTKE